MIQISSPDPEARAAVSLAQARMDMDREEQAFEERLADMARGAAALSVTFHARDERRGT